ncbi:adenylosuccinate synthase [Entomospira culicis]|uniref:Adenylosuccinate synthetase n=1 Tax=Entomospira culicis TaxID=2719989 RepID=A0A968KUI5_9SPIO|nr:adenylosuccinate synthase [Entomospira culicis]NIZ19491.1 adenylosuccinate synthase [Entomospira culicis]NIZ69604.1 adenylosuccinate synthase [Entomospira culicis]WDI36715.1 adenylosuccinate synthase [Entomospira culicis]WDI38344.1 adenylosuccinate synthase [Entomospira culicis]
MGGTVVCGMQWGDEGKGKVIDFLAPNAEVVVRYQGGNNAGHTVVVNGQKYVLHLLPSGVLNEKAICILAPGVVVDPRVLLEEIAALEERGLSSSHILLSQRCHIILPYHIEIDILKEANLGNDKIGTTKRGIGPAYMDKFERTGIRAVDLLNPVELEAKIRKNTAHKNQIITQIYHGQALDVEKIVQDYLLYAKQLAHRIVDTTEILHNKLQQEANVLFEGAQAMMLDIDHGNYPFVTSSSPTTGSASVGAGVGPHWLTRRIGVFKAYATRVGAGPFPTELHDSIGEQIREIGHEFGSTTGRPRRCGWLDLNVLRYAVQINGFTELAIMKADVLDQFDEILLCTAYEANGQHYTSIPADSALPLKPIYQSFRGWKCETQSISTYEELPKELIAYIEFIEQFLGVPIKTISLGPNRHETILR